MLLVFRAKSLVWATPLIFGVILDGNAHAVRRTCRTEPRASPVQTWRIIETANFRVCGMMPHQELERVARTCESLRRKFVEQWLGTQDTAVWQPKCYVVLHPTVASYSREIKSSQTAGSTLIEFRGDKVASRRIDLRADQTNFATNALPHEITHVVLADRFIAQPIPHWADEGMAILAESAPQQELHLASSDVGTQRQGAYRLAHLLAGELYPSGEERALFYGQSVSITKFLVDQGTESKFVRFLETAMSVGYDQALNDHYEINGVAELEARWVQSCNVRR